MVRAKEASDAGEGAPELLVSGEAKVRRPPPQVVVLALAGCIPRRDHSWADQVSLGKYKNLCTQGAVFRVYASG